MSVCPQRLSLCLTARDISARFVVVRVLAITFSVGALAANCAGTRRSARLQAAAKAAMGSTRSLPKPYST